MGRGRGRGKGNRIQKKDFKETRENKWATAPASWEPAELNNADFEEYYKQQGVVPDGEWDAFMSSLRRTLPTTFRINGSGKFALDLRRKLETDFLADMVHGRVSGEIFQPPTPIPWYPDNLAWQLDASRNQLRKVSALARLHEFMKLENDAGGITRQEAVSMIPPLLLDVHPHHSVLDMCAAPGSKTFQLLEALHAGPAPATGLVIANDADVQRCNLLTHQVKRMCSSHLLVTNHEAQNFPSIRALGAVDREGGTLQFDRILCDVPCSGDGTMRKAPDIWRRWTASNGNGLHALQINITLRACQLLKEGGRLVYSTCTFNPIEDEAVVAEILRRTKGSMELVDVPELLPDLKRLPGVHQWKAFDKEKKAFYSTYAEAKEAGASKVDETMFADEASALLPLERCMRVLPHHGDTGGFFIAVFRKIAPVGDLPFRITNSRKRQQMNVDATTAEPAATVAAPVAASAAAAAAVAPAREATPAAEPAEAPVEAPAPVEVETDAQPAAVAEGGNVAADQAVAAQAPVTAADPALVAATAVQPSTGTGVEASAVVQPPKEVKQWGPVANRGGGGRGGGQNGAKWTGVDPVVFITDETILSSLIQFYGMGGPSETVVRSQLVTRSSDMLRPKRLYLVSVAVKELLAADVRNQLKVMSTGVKCFERQESKDGGVRCNYRISQEGLAVLLPLMSAQCFRPTVAEFQRLITERSVPAPMSAALVATDGAVAEMDVVKDDAEAAATSAASTEAAAVAKAEAVNARTPMSDLRTLAQLADVKAGCCVAILRNEDAVSLDLPRESEEESALTAAAPVAVACYRGRGTVSVLVSKPECLVIQEKLRGALARAQAAADALVQPALAVVSGAEPMAVTGAVEGPVVVPAAGLAVAVEAGDAAAEIPVEEMAAAVAIVGDKRSAEGEAAAEGEVPSKRAAL